MYTNLQNVQILIAMLKEFKIDTVVVSPGNSHNAIVRSLESDDYFHTYNIVDERSAAFFAIGLIEELKKPVAICCTSGTAVSNYLSGVTEASRRELPLVIITGDKNPYYLGQYEDQVIDELSIFSSVVRYSCQLPIVENQNDFWYCNRVINEALLEINHHGCGPVQIDVPIEKGMLAIGNTFNTKELPKVTVIKRISQLSEDTEWKDLFDKLAGKKVLLLCGQDDHVADEENALIEKCNREKKYVFAVDKLSNLHGDHVLEITGAVKAHEYDMQIYCPDVVISFAGNTALDYKFKLKKLSKNFEHWIVNEAGRVADPYKNLTVVMECTTLEFLRKLAQFGTVASAEYEALWRDAVHTYEMPEVEYSNLYAISQLMKGIPAKANLHLANSSTIRLAQYCALNPEVQVYCNRGVNGIDGCMSAFIGHAAASKSLSYLIIGDLTFFYDMNALWNRYVGNNVRILLSNNEGAALFHFNQGLEKYPTLNENVAAEHFATAKGWAESQGMRYLSAHTKEEYDNNLVEFMQEDSDKPILFEVFTKKEEDAKIQHQFYDNFAPKSVSMKQDVKKVVKSILGQGMLDRLRGKL